MATSESIIKASIFPDNWNKNVLSIVKICMYGVMVTIETKVSVLDILSMGNCICFNPFPSWFPEKQNKKENSKNNKAKNKPQKIHKQPQPPGRLLRSHSYPVMEAVFPRNWQE